MRSAIAAYSGAVVAQKPAKRTSLSKGHATKTPSRSSAAHRQTKAEVPSSAGGRDGKTAGKFTEIGASGLQVIGGRVNEEFLPLLRGERGIRMWREMGDNDPYSGAILYALLQTVLRAEWSIDLNDAKVADGDFLDQCKEDMSHPFRDVVAESMTMAQYGWAWLETVYKQRQGPDAPVESDFDDGKIGWRKMPLRAQETLYQWIIDASEGVVVGMRQRLWGTELDLTKEAFVDIPLDRSQLFRSSHHKDNPEGRSMLRSGWTAYDKRKKIEVYEGIGVERDMAGIPVFYVPAEMLSPNAPADMQAALAEFHRIGKNLRADDQSHLILPMEYDEASGNPMYKFELAGTGARRQLDTNTIINRLAISQLMSIMADVMFVGHEGQGSLALSRTKEEMFTSGVQSLLDEVRDILNNFAVPRLFRINGDAAPFPQFSTSPIERQDPGEFVANVLSLAQSGMPLWPDDDLDDYIRNYLGWPERSNPGLGMEMNPGEVEPDDGPVVDPNAPGAPPSKAAPKKPAQTGRPTGANQGAQIERQRATDAGKKTTAPAGA